MTRLSYGLLYSAAFVSFFGPYRIFLSCCYFMLSLEYDETTRAVIIRYISPLKLRPIEVLVA